MTILNGVLDLVFAPRCLGCEGSAGPARELVCGRCRSRLLPPPAPLCPRCGFPRMRTGRLPGLVCQECMDWPLALRVARSACLLRPPADALVHQLKYRAWQDLAPFMARAMATVPLPEDVAAEASLVVPVPTTPTRLRQRGYNQAELIARAFAELSRRTTLGALRRAAGASSQTALQPVARLANVAGAFAAAEGVEADLAGEHLLLVDDVLTTGATVTACSQVLVAAGARCVSVLTFARATGRLRLE